MSDEIGELLEKPGTLRCEWRIPNFLSLPGKVGKVYYSPKFLFADSCCYLQIYPNGEKTEKDIGLYLTLLDTHSPKQICYSFGIRNVHGEEVILTGGKETFSMKCSLWGQSYFLNRGDFLRHRDPPGIWIPPSILIPSGLLIPSDVLTITCTLKRCPQRLQKDSLFRRLWNLSSSLKSILKSRERTDVVLKLKSCEINAHRTILESQSAVFSSMFDVDMKESQTGEVIITDCDDEAFKVFLYFAYSGDAVGLRSGNACEVYKIAHKYDFQELVKICTDVIEQCLSVDTVCHVLEFAEVYQEKKLKDSAKVYFAKHKTEIFKSDNWKTYKSENPLVSCKMLECVFGGSV